MIKIKNLTKSFKGRDLFANVTANLPSQGLVVIKGRSGEGKSTFLNLLAMIDDDYQGSIYFEGKDYRKIKHKDAMRFHNFGFIFQQFHLFENLTIKDNILFTYGDNYINNLKLIEIIKKIRLKNNIDNVVRNLSGGEKQKVAIARALFNNPKVLFCDEPTGSLDQNAKKEIVEILKEISKTRLVIVVTHEMFLFEEVLDILYELKNGELMKIETKEIIKISANENETLKSNKLTFKMMFRYILSSLKAKKVRSLIASFSIGIGLFCIGISLLIPEFVKEDIKESLISEFDENKVLIKGEKSVEEELNETYACSEGILIDIQEKYSYLVENIGTFYFSSFESQFPNKNYLEVLEDEVNVILPHITARHINEYRWISEVDIEKIQPSFKGDLNDDECIFIFTLRDIRRICEGLNLKGNNEADLATYIKHHELSFRFCFANEEWEYDDEFYINCKGFIVGEETSLVHTSPRWNETFFEEKMMMKVDDDLLASNIIPWTFKKVFFLKTKKEEQLELLDFLWHDEEFNQISFDFIDESNSTYLCKNNEKSGRIYVTVQDKKRMDIPKITKFLKDNHIDNYFYGTDKTYYVMDELMYNGFASSTFILSNELEMISLIDEYSITEENINLIPKIKSLERGVYGGLGMIANHENLRIAHINSCSNLYGRKADDYGEIVISKKIADHLFAKMSIEDIITREIFFLTIKDSVYDGVHYENEFVYTPLKIVGIDLGNEKWNNIYVDSMWTSYFFIDKLNYKVSEVQPQISVIAFENHQQKKGFFDSVDTTNFIYEVFDPMESISQSIDEVVFFIDIGLLCFSSIAIISAVLMNILVIYLFFCDLKKEIGLMMLLGVSKLSIFTLFILFAISLGFSAFLYSLLMTGTLLVTMFFQLNVTFNISFFIEIIKTIMLMFMVMFAISCAIGGISSLSSLLTKPLKVLKEN